MGIGLSKAPCHWTAAASVFGLCFGKTGFPRQCPDPQIIHLLVARVVIQAMVAGSCRSAPFARGTRSEQHSLCSMGPAETAMARTVCHKQCLEFKFSFAAARLHSEDCG